VISRKQVQTYLAVLGVGMLLGLISGWIIRPALEPAISGNRYLPFAQYEFTEDQQLDIKWIERTDFTLFLVLGHQMNFISACRTALLCKL
jgi:hypothetical protein